MMGAQPLIPPPCSPRHRPNFQLPVSNLHPLPLSLPTRGRGSSLATEDFPAMANYTELLAAAEAVAVAAGGVLMRHFRRLDGYDRKGAVDLVTVADRESEALVVAEIRRRFPDHGILAEEGGLHEAGRAGFQWIIDPLDGTTNYAHGLRMFAVSIAVALDGRVVAGAIHAPALEELYLAELGGGARRNGTPIRVSRAATLQEALLVTGFPYERRGKLDALMGALGQSLLHSQGVLRLGSAALDFAAIAAGHLDGFYEVGLHPWDQAAGMLLVEEAGGRVTGIRPGVAANPFVAEVIATNGHIHEELRAAILGGGIAALLEPGAAG